MTDTPEAPERLVECLRRSWDADQSIISQTDQWMRERRQAAGTIEALQKRVAELEADAAGRISAALCSKRTNNCESLKPLFC